jgi:hypothetical protein
MSTYGGELGEQVTNLLQAKDQPLGSILRALAARGVSRAVASNTIDALVHQGRIVVTDQRRVQLVRNQPTEAAG